MLLRLYITLVILVYMQERYIFQIILLMLMSWTFQGAILYYRPFTDKKTNIIEFFNELMNSVYLYGMLSLTEYMGSQIVSLRN